NSAVGRTMSKANARFIRRGCGCLVAILCVPLMIFALILGVSMASAQSVVQPDGKSDAAVAKYIPKGWQDLLKSAAKTTEQEPDFAIVPWTVLAGIVQVQTD